MGKLIKFGEKIEKCLILKNKWGNYSRKSGNSNKKG